MLEHLEEIIRQWISHGGYYVLFGLLFACGLGLPLPEDVPLITAGILIQQGRFHWGMAAVCAWCGIIGGDCILYQLGRKFGHDVDKIPFIGRHVNRKRMQRVEKWFQRWGVWVVAVGRLFAGVRGCMVVVAGATRFNFWKFLIADGLAAIVSGGLFMLLGYKFAQNLDYLKQLVRNIKGGMLATLLAAVVLIIAYMIWRKIRKSPGDKHDSDAGPPDSPPEGTASPERRPLAD
ncbi:MAG: putative DedA protein family [Phycisphaerales bacterium]|jgi:membrane protein DedA with SNARE-associated domain|nr:putative DedA protein family [Phycisphaerales bacterium]